MPFVQGTTDPTKGTVSQKGTKTNLAEEALASDRSELSQNSGEGFRQGLKDTRNTIAGWGQKAWTKLTSARDFDLDKAIELRETENYLAGIDYTKLTDEGKKEYDNVQNNLIKEWSTVAPYKIDIDKMNETVDNIINSNTYQKAKAVAEKNETEPTYKVDLSKKLKTAFYADVLNGADKKDRFFYNTENGGYTTYKPEETGMIVDEIYNALESRALGWAIDAIAETEDRIREGKPYNAKAYERAKEQYTDLKDFAIYAVNNSEKLEDFGDLVQAYKEETGKNPLVTTNEFGLNENSGTFYSRQFLREDLLDPNLNSGYKIASGIGYLFNAVGTVFDQGMALGVGATNTVKDIFDDGVLFNGNVAKDYELFDNMEFNSIYDSLAKNESGLASARKIAYQVYDRIPDVLSMIGSSPKLFGRTDKILDTLLEQGVRDSAKKFAGTYEKTTEGLTKAIEGIEQLKKGGYVTQQVFKTILKDGILDNVVANAALKGNEYREYTPEDLLFDIGGSIVFDGLFMSLRLAKAGDVLTKNKGLFKQELAKKHFGINDWDRNMMSNDDKLELGRFMDAIVDTTKMTDQMTVKRVEAMKKLVKQQYKDIDSAVDEIMKNAKYQGQKIIDFAANSKKWSNYVTKDANGNNVLKGSLSLDDTLTLRRDYIKDWGKKFDSYIKDKTYQGSRVTAVKESIKEEGLTIDGIKKGWNKFKSLKEEAQKDFLSDMWLNMSSYDQYVFDVWKTKNKLKDATKPTELYAQLQTFKNVLSLHKRELRAQGLARTDWVLRNESALLTKSKTMAERWKDIVLKKMRRSRDPVYSAGHIRDWEDTKFLLTNQVKNNGEEFLAKIFDVIEGTVPPQELELWLYCDPIMRRQGNEFHFRADSIISDGTKWGGRYFNNPLEIAYFVGVEGKIKLPMPDGSERYLYYKMSGDNNPDGLASSIKYDVIDPLNEDFYTSFLIKADGQIIGTDGLSNYLVPYGDYGDENLVWIFENGMNKGDSNFSVFDIEDSDYKKLIDILSTTVDDMTMGTSNDVRQLLEKEIEEVKETQEFPTPNVDPKLTNTQETKEVATEVVGEVNKVTDLGEDSEVVTKEAKEEPISPKKKKELRAQRNALVGILKAVAGTKTNNPGFVDNGIIKKASMGGFIGNELYQDAIGKVPGLEELIDEPTYYRLQKLWNSRGYTTNDIQQSLTKMMNILLSKRYSVNAERGSFSVSFDGGMKKEGKQVYFSEPSWIDEMGEYAGDKGTAIWYSVDEKTSKLKEKKDKEGINYKTGGKKYKDIHILQYRKTKDGYRFESPISKTSDEKYMDIKIIDAYGGKKLRLTGYNKPKADKNYEESSWAPRGTLVFMKDVDPQKLEVDVKKQFNISNVDEVKAQLTFNGKIPLDTEIKDTSTIKDIIDHYAKKFGISISDPRTTLSEIQTNINEEYISDVFEALRDNISQEVSDDALTSYIVEWLEGSDINALINDWRARYGIDPSMIDATDPTEYIRMRIYDDYGLIDTKPNSLFENIGDRAWRRLVDVKLSKGSGLSPNEIANISNDEINRIIKQGINLDNYIDILPEGDPLRVKLDGFGNKRLGFINRRIKSLRSQWIVYDNRREALKNNVIKHHSIKRSIQGELKEGGKLTKEQIQEYRNLGKQIIQESVELRGMWTNIVQQQRALINSPHLWRFVKSYVQGLGGNGNFKDLEEIFEYYNNIIDYDPYKIREEALDKIFDKLTNKGEAPAKKVEPAEKEGEGIDISRAVKDEVEKHITTSKGSYAQRTRENARDSDITIALAYDFNTAGEKLTKNAAGDKYRSVDLNGLSYDEMRRVAYSIANELPAKGSAIINIAGNGMYTLAKHSTEGQEYYNKLLVEFLGYINSRAGIKLKIISGGQTGIDEAGIIAAQRLGLNWEIHTTSDYKFRGIDGKDISDKDKFIERFTTKEIGTPVEEVKDSIRKELDNEIDNKIIDVINGKEVKEDKKGNTTIVKNSNDDRIRNTTKLRDNITVKVKDEPIVEGVTSDNSKAVEIKNDKAKEEIDENNKIVDDDEGILPTKSDGWKQFTLIDDIKYGPGVDPNKTVKTFNIDGSNHTWVSKYSSLFNQKGIDTGNDYLKRIFYQEKGRGETPLSSAIRKLYNVRKNESIINTLYEPQLIFADIQALRYGVPIPEPRLARYMQILGLGKKPKVDTLVRLLADYHHKNYEGLVISNDGNFVRLDQKLRDYDNEARELFTSGLPGLISGLSNYIGFVKKLKGDRETLTNSIKKAVGDSINYDILSPIYVTKRKALEGYKGELEKVQERYDKFYSLLTKANKNRSLTNQEIEKLNKIKKEMTPIKSKITKATKALKKLEDGLLGGMTQSQISIQLRDLIKSQRDLVNSLKGHYDELASKEGQAMWDTIKETDEDDSYFVQYANKELVQKENNKNVKVDTNKKEQDIKQKEDIVKDSKEESYKKEKILLEERAEEIRSKIDTENAKSYRDEEKIEALNQELESVNDSIDDIDYILQTNRVEKASSGGGISDIDKIRSELGKAELRLLELERIERLESSFWKKSNKISGAIYNWLKNISSGELSTKHPFQRWAFSDPESPAKIFYKDRGGNIIEKDLNGDISRFMNRILVYGDLPEYKGEGGGVYKKLNNSIKEFLGIPTDKAYKKISKDGEGFSLNNSLYKSNLFQKGAVVIDSNSIKDIDSSIIDAINSKMNDGKYVIMVSGSNIENMRSLDKQLNDRGYVKIEKRGTNGIPYILQNEGYIYVPKDTDLKAKEKRLIRRAKIDTNSVAETCEISLIAESLEGVDM